ncbi:MAG: peptidoglycan-binding protein [Cyanobacteriota bacterium]|nr:peptidoglycan-binding protein [Cyanobacteriota bacterium]
MDTLAYTHLVSAFESPRQSDVDGSLVLFRGMNWNKISGACCLPIISIAIGAAIIGASQPAEAALHHGDYGSDVKAVQHKLAYYGYFHARATGYYGKITKHAVKAFQRDYGLRVDGVVGRHTASAMGLKCYGSSCYKSSHHKSHYHKPSYKRVSHHRGCNCGHNMSRGSSGHSVVKLQNKLARYGYFHAHSTGYYGKITKHAVKSFQRDYGLHVDGIAGPRTLRAMGL